MRMPWNKSRVDQLDLVDDANEVFCEGLNADGVAQEDEAQTSIPSKLPSPDVLAAEGTPLLLPVDCLEEDPANPRTEFPDAEIAELAQDM